nr:MAG TPA: hypothetical protein [Caudoviricetes sp.]
MAKYPSCKPIARPLCGQVRGNTSLLPLTCLQAGQPQSRLALHVWQC